MLQTVDIGTQCIACYETSAGAEAVAQLRELAAPLRGARVLHLNATPYGGGVAEILRSEVPLLRDLGLAADWKLITGDEAFFSVTKAIHNALQGAHRDLTAAEQETYLASSTRNARLLEEAYDLIVVHDPQPLAILQLHEKGDARWVWRCHIDTSEPYAPVWGFLRPYLVGYDAAVFTLGGFVPPDLPIDRVEIIPPAIDPESPKSLDLGPDLARRVLQWIGVEVDRPLVTQVSRFDPWKDPLGVIAAYRLVKQEVPGLQLALVGSMALDDPEGWGIYHDIQQAAKDDPGVHVFTNLTGVGNVEVNAFQRLSEVVIQKSLREGFGLVVSEALWKGTPVVAGRTGGIPLQLQGGAGGFLVDSVEACAERTLWLLRNPEEAKALGARGHELVRQRFLLTRLIADELRLYASLLGARPGAPAPVAQVGLVGEVRDPVCGMRLDPAKAPAVEHEGARYVFCSEACRQQFTAAPERFPYAPLLPELMNRRPNPTELRQDPSTRDWVVIAPERDRRPRVFRQARPRPSTVAACPFCAGREDETPRELWRLAAPDGGWSVRVVPNGFPVLTPTGTARRALSPEGFVAMPGLGHHEVVIESPEHDDDLARGDGALVRRVLEAYRARYRALRAERAAAILVFRNHGLGAGTSLAHPHSQIVATPVVPLQIRHRFEVAMQHYDDVGTCLYLDILDRELRDGRRIVLQTEQFVAFQPFASMAPFETWIMPRVHQPSFGDASDALLDDLAPTLHMVLAGLDQALGDPDYNYVLQSAPPGDEGREYFVWHVRIVPRRSTSAGFELGSGMHVNPSRPEDTAAALRHAVEKAVAGPGHGGPRGPGAPGTTSRSPRWRSSTGERASRSGLTSIGDSAMPQAVLRHPSAWTERLDTDT